MLIQPKYTEVDGTPLTYLKFLKVILPLSILLRLAMFVSSFRNGPDWYSIGFMLLQLIAVVIAVCGINSMKWYGVISLYALFLIPIADALISILIYIYYGHLNEAGVPFGTILGYLVWLIPSWIYFSKRRLLFDPFPDDYQVAIPKERYQQHEYESVKFIIDEATGEVVREEKAGQDGITPAPAPQPVPASPEAPLEVSVKLDPVETKPTKSHSKITGVRVAIIVLSILCVALIGVAGFLGYRLNETQQELERQESALELMRKSRDSLLDRVIQLREDVSKAENALDSTKDKSFGMWLQLDGIGFIVDGSRYYHRFTCDVYTNASEYMAHNVEYCEYLGYSKCPQCW